MSDPSKVELRGEIDRRIIDVLDAVSKAKRISRMEQVAIVLDQWAREKVHEANLVQSMTRGHGINTDTNR